MAGILKLQQVQLGDSVTAANNFILSVPAVPDGTLDVKRGDGTSVLNVASDGSVSVKNIGGAAVMSIATNGRITGKGLPFAGAEFSVTGGVLTVHSSFGMTMSRVSVGRYQVTFTVPVPANYAAAINQVRSVTWTNSGCAYLKALHELEFVENSAETDVGASAYPSSVLFFEV